MFRERFLFLDKRICGDLSDRTAEHDADPYKKFISLNFGMIIPISPAQRENRSAAKKRSGAAVPVKSIFSRRISYLLR